MPKRSDRVVFNKHFDGNPFDGVDPQTIYKKLRWGNNPKKVIQVYAPEPIVGLGHLAKLFLEDGSVLNAKNKIHLAVGANTNFIYLFPNKTTTIPYHSEKWKSIGLVKQTDYYSDKGNEDCYYYHEHEAPYPILSKCPGKSIYMLIPQSFKGRRSYAVIKEGIVG